MTADPKGYLIDTQHFSVNDGDGIRTTIFFAGCNMRCQWCANPESFTTFDKILHSPESCVRCGRCVEACPYGIGMNLSEPDERAKCKSCGRCVPICPSGSRKSAVLAVRVSELLARLDPYRLFYRYSGGETTGQFAFLDALSEALYDSGLDLCLESNGDFNYARVKPVLERLSLCFIDIKHPDEAAHRRFTGTSGARTLANVRAIGQSDLPLVVRVPVIESVNAEPGIIQRIARFVRENVAEPRMELLPYHAYGEIKYRSLGLRSPDPRFRTPEAAKMRALEEVVRREGVRVEHFL